MKNRALYLALKEGIYSVEEFARLVDISVDQANRLFYEDSGIEQDTINKCCLYFNVSVPYFCCITE